MNWLRIIPASNEIAGLLVMLVGLLILWIIVSIPVYIAGKVVTHGRTGLLGAMSATFLGPVVYAIILVGVDFFLDSIVGGSAFMFALVLAFIAWLGVFKTSFQTGWLGALAIAVLALLAFVVLAVIIGVFFSVAFPQFFFPVPFLRI